MNKMRPWFSWALLAVVFLILAVGQYRFVKHYAVNMLYWDQFGLYEPVFHNQSWWTTFDYQWGPHRQGLGGLCARTLANISHLNSTWDSFGVSFTLTIAAAVAIAVAYRCGATQAWALLAIPLVYFNRRQYEQLVFASNISHGSMPVLLFTLFCLAWFVRQRNLRLLLLTILIFFLIFTGFGLFVGMIFPCVLVLELVQNLRARRPIIAIIISLICVGLTWYLFSRNYVFWPAVPNFKFPYDKPIEYFLFIGVMLSNFFGYTGSTHGVIAFGLFVALVIFVICAFHGWKILIGGVEERPANVVMFSLSAFTILYCANCAIGRVSLGWQTCPGVAGSRYVTLMIPGGFAIGLQLLTLQKRKLANVLGLIYALAIVYGVNHLNVDDWTQINGTSQGRAKWRHAYLMTHDQVKANQLSGFQVTGFPSVGPELDYMEANHLNLFIQHDGR